MVQAWKERCRAMKQNAEPSSDSLSHAVKGAKTAHEERTPFQ